jgi:hypothetical protein
MNLTPQQLAQVDQALAAGNKDLDEMVLRARALIRQYDFALAVTVLSGELQTVDSTDYLGAMAGLALGRLAQIAEAKDGS